MSKDLKISLVGNPNTGKSSLFNALTGLKQKVGNFPGITVEKSTGYFSLTESKVEITDLPGTYSLFPKSPDEAVPYDIILNPKNPHHPDLVLFIADASNLKRNLVLLTQIIDLKIPVILALNMLDYAKAKGVEINIKQLSASLQVPVVPINARKREGIPDLIKQIEEGGHISGIDFLKNEPNSIPWHELAKETGSAIPYQAILSLHRSVAHSHKEKKLQSIFDEFRKRYPFDAGAFQRKDFLDRYKQVKEILALCMTEQEGSRFSKTQENLDKVLTHPFWGFVIFFATLFVIFQSIFNLARYPMDWIGNGFSALSGVISSSLPEGVLNNLVTNGILPGLSGVLVFIPQIAFLFFFITILEDTGYLARVAFIMDRTMRHFGLNGKSVIPLISGTACAVPAIMATRNIENRTARIITILVTPLMSCSARLPVYILLIGIIVPNHYVFGFLNLQGMALMSLYVLGFLSAIGAAWVFKQVMNSKVKQYFILELPAYRIPNPSNIWINVVKKVKTFVSQAGKIIIAISIILWFLASFGPPGSFDKVEKKYAAMQPKTEDEKQTIEKLMHAEKLENSFAGVLGHTIEPVIRPLGFDWKIGIAIITSFAAREVFVGTMATIYGLEGDKPDFSKIKENMLKERDPVTLKPIYTTASVLSLLIFYVFAMQCMSTMAITYKETASIRWTLVQLFFMSGLAYIASLIIYQLMR